MVATSVAEEGLDFPVCPHAFETWIYVTSSNGHPAIARELLVCVRLVTYR